MYSHVKVESLYKTAQTAGDSLMIPFVFSDAVWM